MRIPIGAMSVGDILDRGLKILLARLPTYYAINFIVLAPVLVLQLAMAALHTGGMTPSPAEIAAGSLIAVVLTLILQPVATAAILHIISQEFIDQRASMSDALRFALSRFAWSPLCCPPHGRWLLRHIPTRWRSGHV